MELVNQLPFLTKLYKKYRRFANIKIKKELDPKTLNRIPFSNYQNPTFYIANHHNRLYKLKHTNSLLPILPFVPRIKEQISRYTGVTHLIEVSDDKELIIYQL